MHFQNEFGIHCVPDEFPSPSKHLLSSVVIVWHGAVFSSFLVLEFDSPVSKMHSMFLAFDRCVRVEEDDDDAMGGCIVGSFQDGMMNGLKCNYSEVIHEKEV